MSKYHFSLGLLAALVAFSAAPTVRADNLLLNRVQQEHAMDLPARGLSMSQVQSRYGAPLRKLSPRGGGKPQHPVINRWEYPNYIVFFERSRVIHSVLNTPAGNNTQPSAVP
ncbi:MAG: hypothetical protein ABW154_10160 [Dyella sp.]